MEKTREGLCSLINKVDICLKGNVISNEEVLKIEEQFLTEAYKDGREHKTLFIQHTGSDYYDAIAFAIAVLSLIFMDETKAIDVTKDIEEGDIVTFRSKRWIYSGTTVIDGVERYVLKGDKRIILKADELTSRVSTTELNQTLNKLEKIHYSQDNWDKKIYPVNLLLATNMISVGIDVDRLNAMVILGQPKLTSEYIQASSRVGRKYPGVVFVQYDGVRSRDRSHYEQFKSYHESFYRYVEPTGVTPFSEPARKRALHAVIISLIRHNYFETDEELRSFDKNDYDEELKELSDYVVSRMDDINSRLSYEISDNNDEVREEIDIIYEKINRLVEHANHEKIEYGNIMGFKKPDMYRILKPFGVDEEEYDSFNTMTSMRNVEAMVNVNVIVLEDEDEKNN